MGFTILQFVDFEVMVEYRDNGEYTLTAVTEEGKMATPVQASCRVEEEEGLDSNLVMTGFLEEKRVVANIATVDDKLHIFTSVSYVLCLLYCIISVYRGTPLLWTPFKSS